MLTSKLFNRLINSIMVDPREPHLHLLREVLPALAVVSRAGVQRQDPRERVGEHLVQGQADHVDEAHLHLG